MYLRGALTWLQAVVVLAIWEKYSYGESLCAQVDLKFVKVWDEIKNELGLCHLQLQCQGSGRLI